MKIHCLHLDNAKDPSDIFQLPDAEIKHAKSLRIREGEIIRFTSFAGWFGKGIFLGDKIKIQESELNSISRKVFIGISDRGSQKNCVESAIALGYGQIIFVKSKYSDDHRVNIEKLYLNAKAAQKQSFFCGIVNIQCVEFSQIPYQLIAVFDPSGENILNSSSDLLQTWPFIGPPGGFSDEEIAKFTIKLSLPSNILKTELAIVLGCGLFNLLKTKKN